MMNMKHEFVSLEKPTITGYHDDIIPGGRRIQHNV